MWKGVLEIFKPFLATPRHPEPFRGHPRDLVRTP